LRVAGRKGGRWLRLDEGALHTGREGELNDTFEVSVPVGVRAVCAVASSDNRIDVRCPPSFRVNSKALKACVESGLEHRGENTPAARRQETQNCRRAYAESMKKSSAWVRARVPAISG
jgi:hypothetical protein